MLTKIKPYLDWRPTTGMNVGGHEAKFANMTAVITKIEPFMGIYYYFEMRVYEGIAYGDYVTLFHFGCDPDVDLDMTFRDAENKLIEWAQGIIKSLGVNDAEM